MMFLRSVLGLEILSTLIQILYSEQRAHTFVERKLVDDHYNGVSVTVCLFGASPSIADSMRKEKSKGRALPMRISDTYGAMCPLLHVIHSRPLHSELHHPRQQDVLFGSPGLP